MSETVAFVYDENALTALRASLTGQMSEKRKCHTLGVERAVEKLAVLYLPEKVGMLRAAALLHDLTKEYTNEEHLGVLASAGVKLSPSERLAPKTFHAQTAAILIPRLYPQYASEELVSCVRWHTTGHADMTLAEKLVYLADYIEDTRTFEDCVKLREAFWSAHPEDMTKEERLAHLRDVLIYSYDMTVAGLLAERIPIHEDTVRARNALIVGD